MMLKKKLDPVSGDDDLDDFPIPNG